jgi:hypothetical protein
MHVRYSSSFIFTSLVPYILWIFSYISWLVERFRTLAGWVVRLMIHSVKVEQIAPEILKDLLSDASGSWDQQWCSLRNLWTVDLLECLNFAHCYNSWGLYSLSGVCKYIRQFWTLCMRVGCECCLKVWWLWVVWCTVEPQMTFHYHLDDNLDGVLLAWAQIDVPVSGKTEP